MSVVTYLGLGSNLGDRAASIAEAVRRLDELGRVLAVAPLYETEPWGLREQPRFLNSACALETALLSTCLLEALKRIEQDMGRVKTVPNGPRPIDLDILLYGQQRVQLPYLSIPHPGMLQRATVLVPLNDIAAEVPHPVSGLTIREHLEAIQPVKGIAPYPPGLN